MSIAPDTEAIYLFGSYAYGTPHKYSDLDIFIIVPNSYTDECELQHQISCAICMAIDKFMSLDVLINTYECFHENLKYMASIDSVIARKGIKLYG